MDSRFLAKTTIITFCALFWFIAFLLILLARHTNADNHSPWLAANQHNLEFIRDLPAGELLPSTIHGNRDCEKREVLTHESRPWILQAKASFEACVVDAQYGTVGAGYLKRPGTNMFGRVISSVNKQPVNIAAIPGSPMMLQFTSGPINGLYVSIRHSEASIEKSSANLLTGAVTHEIKPVETIERVRYSSGSSIPITADSIAFSNNGKWLVGDISNVGKVRVNTETREVLLFGSKMQYGLGFDPTPQMAVSGDGRYVVTADVQHNLFSIYDLSTCRPDTSQGNTVGLQTCDSKDLLPQMRDSIPGLAGASTIRFRGDYTFDFYAFVGAGNSLVRKHYVLTAAGQQRTLLEYLALGDSFASGEGAHAYKPTTDTDNNKCHLSQVSYPYLIGASLNLDSYESVACSGAKIEDINIISGKYGGQETEKVAREDRNSNPILANFSVGKIAQHEFVSTYRPRVITLSAGGNDVGFRNKIIRCAMIAISDTCFKYYEDRLEAVLEVNAQFERMVSMYRQVKEASPGAKVYITGYPQIAHPGGNCAVNVSMERGDLEFGRDFINYLNYAIELAAKKAGVFYVDVSDAFVNYRLCETSNKKNIAVNGITNGDDFFGFFGGPIGNESFHPTAKGQELLANEVLRQTNNLTAVMPLADHSIAIPAPTDTMDMLKDLPKQNRAIRWLTHLDEPVIENTKDAYGGIKEAGSAIKINFRSPDVRLSPNSQLDMELHSEPIHLGTAVLDENGEASFEITIPEGTPPGYHTLHFYGKNTSDQDVDLYQGLFVVASMEDYDGDGIPNDQELCLFVEPAYVDADGDGIDDACDGVIGDRPTEEPEPGEEIETPTEPSDEKPLPENNENEAGREPIVTPLSPHSTPVTSNPETSRIAQELQPPEPENEGEDSEVLGETADTSSINTIIRASAHENDAIQKTSETNLLGKILIGSLLAISIMATYLVYRQVSNKKV